MASHELLDLPGKHKDGYIYIYVNKKERNSISTNGMGLEKVAIYIYI